MPAQDPPVDDAIRAVVKRLSRPHPSGGAVIESAAIRAEGADSAAIVDWVLAHAGEPEIVGPAAPKRGLYGTGFGGAVTAPRTPARYVLPPGALTAVAPTL
jgi:hypothetical protein